MKTQILHGIGTRPVEIQVKIEQRLPAIVIVGLPAATVKETAERVRSAIEAAGFKFPRKRVIVEISPGVEGTTALDLPIALAILAAEGIIPAKDLNRTDAVGELSLGGSIRPVRGIPSYIDGTIHPEIIIPADCEDQVFSSHADVFAATTLAQAVAHLRGVFLGDRMNPVTPSQPTMETYAGFDLNEVKGLHEAKRVLEIAAAGRHNVLLLGPPGSGKSMLARRLTTILPPLSPEKRMEIATIHAAAGLPASGSRPFRAPHWSVSSAGMFGTDRPGEVTLAHNGVLYLDEGPEFTGEVLGRLNTVVQDRRSYGRGGVFFPTDFRLVVSANLCPCGRRGTKLPCTCTPEAVKVYLSRLAVLRPSLDLRITMTAPDAATIMQGPAPESSSQVRARVEQVNPEPLKPDFGEYSDILSLTRLYRVASTIAQLERSEDIKSRHFHEASILTDFDRGLGG